MKRQQLIAGYAKKKVQNITAKIKLMNGQTNMKKKLNMNG